MEELNWDDWLENGYRPNDKDRELGISHHQNVIRWLLDNERLKFSATIAELEIKLMEAWQTDLITTTDNKRLKSEKAVNFLALALSTLLKTPILREEQFNRYRAEMALVLKLDPYFDEKLHSFELRF
jgi:hypothetical protein